MELKTTITQTRRYLTRHKKELGLFFAGWVVGLFLNLPSIDAISTLFHNFSRQNMNRLSLLLLILVCILSAWIILLKNNLKAHQKYLKQLAPGFDVDAQEEHSEIRSEIIKEENL